ncbi:MAG: biotin--[acetyl-CoA-carboxylase] ligase [Rickettsiaceae bacterium]|nr:biotin--[acetyl-CoA-carboxylase] ligase [Rickettsiaceae bacterium]
MQNWKSHYNILDFETVDSTNSEALRLASSGVRGDFLIRSQQQTGGRGQKGREWVSINGNLHASILLESPALPKNNPQLSFVIANAMYDSIFALAKEHKASINIELKWPNDILIEGKKVAGILLESINFQNKTNVVIGFGVNVAKAPSSLGQQFTCLFDEGIILDNSDVFLDILMNNFNKLYQKWCLDNNFISTRKNWMQHAHNLNKVITINDGVDSISGEFKEIDDDGALCLQLEDGRVCVFYAGDISIDEKMK